MHRGAIADAETVTLSLVGYTLIWRARSERGPQASCRPLSRVSVCLAAHPQGSLKQAASCSFLPSFSISLGVVEKRDEGELVKGKLVHNLRIYIADG